MIVCEADAAEYRIEPSITVREEYNDNIFLSPVNEQSDYISEVIPSVVIVYRAPLWDWNASLAYDYWYYALAGYQKDQTYDVNLTNETRIVRDVVFLRVSEVYSRVSLDITRDFTQQSSFVNQTDENTVIANPYVTLHPGARTTVYVGYIYENIWYKDPTAINKVDNSIYAETVHDLTSRLSTTIGARYHDNKNSIQNYKRTDAYAGLKYEYTEGSIIYGTIGNIWIDLENSGYLTQPFWNAGFQHAFPKFSFSFETSLQYIEDPTRILRRQDQYIATIKREVERTQYSVFASFYEYRNAFTNHLEDSSYNVGGNITHRLTTNSSISLNLTYQRLEDAVNNTYTEIYLAGGRYEYLLHENLTLALEYRYTNSYSPEIFANDYYNNRIFVELRKRF